MDVIKQIKGGCHDSVEHLGFESVEDCDNFYDLLIKVFYNISSWSPLFDNVSEFQMMTFIDTEKVGKAVQGDLVKIKIPGPKSKLGHGYDWVKVEATERREENGYITDSILLSPYNTSEIPSTNHFFTSEAKNYFIIKKHLKGITAEVHGRNEVPNCEGLPILTRLRNFTVAKGGIFGASKIHWKTWCKNILTEEYITKCI